MKTCSYCGQSKPLSEFHKDKSRKDGLQYRCKICDRPKNKRWQQNNREKELFRNRCWRQANPDKEIERGKRWRQSNPDKVNARSAKYRATRLQATPSWLTSEHHAEIELCYEEAIALRMYTGQDYHVDHIVPLRGETVCGLHVPWNLQVIPAKENLTKSNKL